MKKIGLLSLFVLASTALAACATTSTKNLVKENEEQQQEEREEEKHPPLKFPIGGGEGVKEYLDSTTYDEAEVLKQNIGEGVDPEYKPSTTEEGTDAEIIVTHKERGEVKNGSASVTDLQLNDQLFPGALVMPDEKLSAGHPTFVALNRGKLPFMINLPDVRDPSFEETPSMEMVTSENGPIRKQLSYWCKDDKHSRTADMNMDCQEAFSKSQVDTQLGLGIGDMFHLSEEIVSTHSKRTYIATFTDVFYSVTVDMSSTQGQILANNVTLDQLKAFTEAGEKYLPPLLVTNCKYGRMIFLKIETDLEKEKVETGLKYAGAVDAEAKNTFNETFKNSSISCICYGGTYVPPTEWKKDPKIADRIIEIFSKDNVVNEQILNGKLLSYSCNFIDNTKKFAAVYSATSYVNTTYQVLKEQVIEVHNHAAFTLDCFGIWGSEIVGWNPDGTPIYQEMHPANKKGYIYYTSSNMNAGATKRVVRVSPRYAKLMFFYDIFWGPEPAFNGRLQPNQNWFEKCEIEVKGALGGYTTKITIDDTIEFAY